VAEIDYNALAAKHGGVAVIEEEEKDSPINYAELAAQYGGVAAEEPPQEIPTPEKPQPSTSTETSLDMSGWGPQQRRRSSIKAQMGRGQMLTNTKDDTGSVAEDAARVTAKLLLGPTEIVFDAVDAAVTAVSGRELDPSTWASIAKNLLKGYGLTPEQSNKIIDEYGKIRNVETTTGQVLDAAAFMGTILTGKKMLGESVGFFKDGAKWLASSVAAGQALSDKDANVANLIESLYEDEAGAPPESTMNTIAQFLSADKDDPEMEKRFKLFAEEVLFGAIFGTPGAVKRAFPWLVAKSREMYKSRPWQLTKKQEGEIAFKYLKDARDDLKASLRTDHETPLPTELVDEGGARILRNSNSVTRRFIGRFFTPGGAGLTKKTFNAFEDSRTAQRQVLSRAEFLSGQLKRSLDRIGDADKSAAVGQRVQAALNSDTAFLKDLTGKDRISAFAKEHDLPASVAAHTLEARDLIDSLSKDLTTVRMADNLREIIQDNAGSYVRRSYRLFEDPNYVPSDDVRKTAVDYIANSMMNAEKSLDEHTALVRAANSVDKILAKGDGKEIYDHIINSKRVASEILGHKKAIPQEIRALMGEIQEPSENILLTISKMSKLYETNRFFERFYALGKSGKYVVDPDDMPLAGDPARKGWTQIQGTNSVLDGKFAPDHVVDAIHEKDAHFQVFLGKDGTVSPWWRNFLYAKGASQSMKTVYSHVTHARNVVGGMQFGTANGASPFSRESIENFRILKQKVSKGGDKALQAKYEEFLELGIINTNVTVNNFRALLNAGSESTAGNVASKLAKLGDSYGVVKKAKALGRKYVVDAPQDIYMATDDFFKINYYQQELRTLQRAFPDEPIGSLKKQASDIVRDTFPNYDRVPRGVQAARELPLGSFMAFPTEIMRTSTHIIRRASKEITSGSPVLRARGLRRLAGFATTTSGWAGASAVSAQLLGWTEEEEKAHHILSETPFSKDAPRIWVTTDDGIKSIDTQFLDSYSVIKGPLMAAYREIEIGQLQGEALDEYLVNALRTASWQLLEPYASEAMLTETFLDVGYALEDPEGRLPSGKAIFGDKLDAFDQAWGAIAHIGKSLGPGSVLSAKQLVDAATGKPHRITGDTNDTKLALITQASGFKFTNHEPADSILWAAKKWNGANFNASSLTADYEATGEDLAEQHYNIEKKRFEASQEFYRKINASLVAVGSEDTEAALIGAKVNEDVIVNLMAGLFTPRPLSENLRIEMYQKTPTALEGDEAAAYNKIMGNYSDMLSARLDQPFEVRHRKATGGVVEDVPQAPKEPDERIDKMTGRPYNEQAGGAFIDAEDPLRRLGFVGGGLADNPLRRLGFGEGGSIRNNPITEHHLNNLKNRAYVIDEEDGSVKTVYTIQVNDKRLHGGAPTLIPTIYNGKQLGQEEAIYMAVESGKSWPTAKTHPELRARDIEIHRSFNADVKKHMDEAPEDDNPIRRPGFGVGGKALELFLPRLVKTIKTHSKRDISTEEAEQAARNIEDSLNVSDDIDVPSGLESNPELEDYVIRLTRSRLDEKNDLSLEQLEKIPEWKAAQEGTGTWQEFSRKRPNRYTEEEIENEALVQGRALEFDPNMELTHTVNDALRSIDALDRPSAEAAKRNFEDFWLQKRIARIGGAASTALKENIGGSLREKIADLSVDEKRMLTRIERDMPAVPVRKTLPDEMVPISKAKRAENQEDFIRNSKEKDLWYRGTSSAFDLDYEVNFAFPREIGTHVGTRGQATDIVAHRADIRSGADFNTRMEWMLLSAGKMRPGVADEMFEQAGRADAKGSPYALEEHPPAITSGYIRVQKPLVIRDLGSWAAEDILSDKTSLGRLEAALSRHAKANMTKDKQKIFRTLVKDVDDFNSKQMEPSGVFRLSTFKRELYEADFNIRLRKFIESLGFDSIKYKNTGEGRFLGEGSFSYILFRPNQFKSKWAQKFDPADSRQNKVTGGKASKDPRKEAFIRRLQLNVGGYLIESGDTLSGIARETGSTVEELQKLNKIKDVDKIYAGKTLKVPEYLKPKEEVSLAEEDQQQFSDDVAVALVEKVFSPDDLETELLETRERATTVVKSKIPKKPSEDFVPVDKARQSPEESREMTFYDKLDAVSAPADYVIDLANKWHDTREDVNRRYDAGEITAMEQGLWNAVGHIETATTPLVDLLGAVAGGTARFLGVDDELAEIGKAISDTEAVKSLIELMKENPRAARNIESVAQIIGARSALTVFTRGFNRIAEGVKTKQEGFYDPGRTALGQAAIVGRDFVKKVPSAVLDAVVPWRSRARDIAGAAKNKISDELNEAIRSADRFASMLTARYIRWQSRERNTGILDDVNSPVALANEYKFLNAWNEAEVRKQIFEDIPNGGNLGLRVPDAIQDIASAHIKNVWGTGNKGIKESNTGVVIKRPDGPQSLGNEALNNGSRNPSPIIKEILGPGGVSEAGRVFKSSTDKMLKFLNDRNRKVIGDKAGYNPMKSANEISSQDFKDYLTFKKIDFEKGPGDFIIIRGSHASESKEIGGVNDFIAIDTKKGDVFSLISDKHDIGGVNPINGRSLLTVQPMVSRNFKTLEIPKSRPRDIAAERAAARKLAKETNVPLRANQESSLGFNKTTGAPRNAQGFPNSPVLYMEDVLRAISSSKRFTAEDVKDSIRRTGLVASSQNVYRDTSENAPEIYRDKINVLTALRRLNSL
tara:strand:+ start:7665 stop:15707 length:8043 start_codon:yes stop_codon:yes gene_type:complete